MSDVQGELARGRKHLSLLVASRWLRWRGTVPREGALQWIFMATLPNSGSTAMSRIIETSPGVHTLQSKGEGQWLIPQMSADRKRWDPELPLDYRAIRRIWLHHATQRTGGSGIILEKSPANIVRMRELMAAFSDMNPQLLILTRDPMAVCASWAKRYPPKVLTSTWLPSNTPVPRTDESYFRLLGKIAGERMQFLTNLTDIASCVLSYEEFTGHPKESLSKLRDAFPLLGPLDAAAVVKVKDYPPQFLRNMNEEQVSGLSDNAREWVRAGLRPFSKQIATFGYSL